MSAAPPGDGIQVWDPVVRILHWSLVFSVVAAWVTHEAGAIHDWFGYAALVVAGLRLAWGFIGPRSARFASFLHGPRETLAYARRVGRGAEPRHLGHNPLGAWMILALLGTVILLGASGWLATTDAYWGDERVEEAHELLSHAILVFIALHVAGVVFTARRHRENLVAAMWHGRKRVAERGDIAP